MAGWAIRRGGKFKKFVPEVDQISFSGHLARERGQRVTFVTDRAVFEMEADGIVLTEIAPGVRLQEDVLDQIGFPHPNQRHAQDHGRAHLPARADGHARRLHGPGAAPHRSARVMSDIYFDDVVVGATFSTAERTPSPPPTSHASSGAQVQDNLSPNPNDTTVPPRPSPPFVLSRTKPPSPKPSPQKERA